ncbi:hypothetical protein PFAG_05365 [Plasmodium falciparum Santa Lucia]|uniref:CPW-WPC domain-containing protein n=1 Tax=Plasmodium falciparum Santa Lucia TaxID=478859 RepID=W7FAB4_PLAFA|nr:hypothetical protein PFAG_05365 [Plasmodium falciparum Santa Lucia]
MDQIKPCLDNCEKDYSSQCPTNWVPEDEKYCRPLSIYEGTCLLPYDFSNMTNEQKEIWSNKCSSSWPCKEKCKKDYSKICPKGWIKESDGVCSAPKNYNGPCLSRASLITLDKDMKKMIIEKSGFSSCIFINIFFNKFNKIREYLFFSPPFNWNNLYTHDISILLLLLLKNDSFQHFLNKQSINNIIISKLFPYIYIYYINYCIAPQSYMGPCSKKKSFQSFKKEIKKAYAEECDIEWPLYKNSREEYLPKISTLRKGKYSYGSVEPITGNIISTMK